MGIDEARLGQSLVAVQEIDAYGRSGCWLNLPASLSLNHFVRARQHRLRDCESERLRGLEIYDELEFRWLLDWQVRGSCVLENLVDEPGCCTPNAT